MIYLNLRTTNNHFISPKLELKVSVTQFDKLMSSSHYKILYEKLLM